MTDRPTSTVRAYAEAGEDAALITRVLAGETEAYDRLFHAHYARIYNFAAKLTGSPDAAEDIAQLAFVRAYESLPRLRDRRTFLKFLYRICVNLVRDQAKSQRRKPVIAFLDILTFGRSSVTGATEAAPLADPGLDPARIVGDRAFAGAIREQIAALPLHFREALLLHHIEGMDIREISDVLGVPEGTVKSRLSRARLRLQKALSAWMDVGSNQNG